MMSKSARTRGVFLGLALAMIVSATSGVAAAAPTPEELKAARELFQEAYKDEQEKRFPQALEKFNRVAAVKESASVRYRIASVLEQLGRLRESRDAFRALAASRPNLPPNEQEVADSSAERAHALDKKIPRIILNLRDTPPPDTRVYVDGAPVPASTTPRQVELDPGEHLVQASSPTSAPTESKVHLSDGAEVAVTVVLTPLATAKTDPVPPPAPEPSHRDRTLAYIALGAGGVLLGTGLVLLAVREGNISDLEKACPGGSCPPARRTDLESTRDQAELFGPLGVGIGVVGLAAIGAGAYLLFRPAPAASASAASASASSATGGSGASDASRRTTSSLTGNLRFAPRVVMGGAMVGLGGAF